MLRTVFFAVVSRTLLNAPPGPVCNCQFLSVLGENEKECTLRDLCSGKIGVIDIWHTKCQKCPAALDKFNGDAEEFSNNDNVSFIALALSLGSGNKEDVAELGPETWENITHAFVEENLKEEAKSAFGYASVPFYVVFNKDGSIIKMGDSKSVNYMSEIKEALEKASTDSTTSTTATDVKTVEAAGANVFTLDEDF